MDVGSKPLDQELKKNLQKIAGAIRQLSMDAVQKANSGHPGLPMGCAELGAYLYGYMLKHNPKNPKWLNRDRFVLSAGHGSMLLYSCLHLSGFNLDLEEIKNFRQFNSLTPGHPEFHVTEGVEATTGPLGQGIGNAVGMALGLKILAAKFNTPEFSLFNSKVYCLAGDGCMMEGVSSEASSFAGHLHLDNLILIYDSNKICLDGPLEECCSEDTAARYKSYGWDVYEVDGHDLDQIDALFQDLKRHQKKPVLLIAHTTIGKGSPNKAGTSKVHGSPLGPEEVLATKQALNLPNEDFYIPQSVKTYFEKKLALDKSAEHDWNQLLQSYAKKFPEKYQEFEAMKNHHIPSNLEEKLKEISMKSSLAGRSASQEVLQLLGSMLPQLIGGSADLSCSDLTMMKNFPIISRGKFSGKNIKFGVREFAMGTIANGLALTQMLTPYVGTFLTFSDYMRNSIRLAALSKIQVIYQFTHDSVFLGEDGPTHQPIEHYASLRTIPDLHVIRPADNHEVKMAWIAALNYKGPTAILLSRQNLPELSETNLSFQEGFSKGGYVVKKEKDGSIDFTLFATGSELHLALQVASELEKRGKNVRVVSMPCFEIFDKQSTGYKNSVVGGQIGKRVCIEAGVDFGWHKYIGMDGIAICMETYGVSAPASILASAFGFDVNSILERILS